MTDLVMHGHASIPEHIVKAMNPHYNYPPENLREISQSDWLRIFSTTVMSYSDHKQVNVGNLPEGELRERFKRRGYIPMSLWCAHDATGIALGIVYESADSVLMELARLAQLEAMNRHRHDEVETLDGTLMRLGRLAQRNVEARDGRGGYHHIPVYLAFGCEHAFRSYTAEEAREKGWSFTHGRCLHHNVCTKCGAFNNYDSGD